MTHMERDQESHNPEDFEYRFGSWTPIEEREMLSSAYDNEEIIRVLPIYRLAHAMMARSDSQLRDALIAEADFEELDVIGHLGDAFQIFNQIYAVLHFAITRNVAIKRMIAAEGEISSHNNVKNAE